MAERKYDISTYRVPTSGRRVAVVVGGSASTGAGAGTSGHEHANKKDLDHST